MAPARTNDVTATDELIRIRHFLERTNPAEPAATQSNGHCLVLINHHQVRIFHSAAPGTAAEPVQQPHEPAEFFRHLAHSKDFARGQEKPDPNSFFPPVANALKEASQILLFGSGTGKSSEMEQFAAWLNTHHPELARRIVGSLIVDEHHLTDDQLLAKAREFYATPRTLAAGASSK